MNGLNIDEKFLAAKQALDGEARQWLDSQEGIKSWDLLLQGLIATFGRQKKSSDKNGDIPRRWHLRCYFFLKSVLKLFSVKRIFAFFFVT